MSESAAITTPALSRVSPARVAAKPANAPLVAIVTPVYNGAEFLDATMQCVQRQTYPNLVHVILDNASTDATPAIIERYKNGRAPLSVHRNATALPQAQNWNAALKHVPANASYVQWLCADDLIRSDAIEKLVAKAETDPAVMAVGSVDVVHNHARAPHPGRGRDVVDGKAWIESVCENRYGHYPWATFFIRWTDKDRAGDFFEDLPLTFDTLAVLRKIAEGKVGFVMEPLVYTRQHVNNYSSTVGRRHEAAMRFWRWQAALEHAALLGDERKLRRMLRGPKNLVLRYRLYYLLTGAREDARKVVERLRADGYPPRPWEYVSALLAYPPSWIARAMHKLSVRRRWPQEITEADFTAS